jgi:hypothetical protein
MALAHEVARGGCPQGLSGAAVVSVSVGERTVVPGAHARVSARAVTRADGAAVAERHRARSHGRVAAPQDHDGGPRLSRVTGEVRFAPREWHTMYTLPQHRHPPQAPPSLRAMVRGLAHLGGV